MAYFNEQTYKNSRINVNFDDVQIGDMVYYKNCLGRIDAKLTATQQMRVRDATSNICLGTALSCCITKARYRCDIHDAESDSESS